MFFRRSAGAVLGVFLAFPAALVPLPSRAELPPLIPRNVLFGNPERTAPQISPDGTKMAYLAPSGDVLAVWVATIGKTDDRVVASDRARPIRNVFWAPDGTRILYLQDVGGNENFHMFAAGLDGTPPADLTPYDGVRVNVADIDYRHPEAILIEMNKRDKKLFDVYRLDVATRESTIVAQNPGNVAGWLADSGLNVRAGLAQNQDGSSAVIVRDTPSGAWRTIASYGAADGFPNPQAFSQDGKDLYVITSHGVNAAQLVRYDLRTGASAVVASDPNYDVSGALFSPDYRLVAAAILRERAEWSVLDPAYRADFETLKAANPGDFQVVSVDNNDRTWIVAYTRDTAPVSYWSYDRTAKRATQLFSTRPSLAKYTLATMTPIEFSARDGLRIHGYLTTPAGIAAKDLPMVLLVHGGPWARDEWGYSSYPQWLANRGYAVLQVNFRGSTGYGSTFLNAGDRQWAGSMHTDLLDAKDWAVRQGYADPKRLAIMGGSYGGYATLAAVAFSPSAFTCGVDIVGPSNLNTLLASIPPYWETERVQFTKRMGDSVDYLNSQSPLFKAAQIQVPLLIGQGANDPRVNIRESDQIVEAMRKNNKPVTYVVFPDEGHGFARPENSKRFNAETESFLGKCLGGRVEPAGPGETIDAFLK